VDAAPANAVALTPAAELEPAPAALAPPAPPADTLPTSADTAASGVIPTGVSGIIPVDSAVELVVVDDTGGAATDALPELAEAPESFFATRVDGSIFAAAVAVPPPFVPFFFKDEDDERPAPRPDTPLPPDNNP